MPDLTTQGAPAGAATTGQTAELEQMQDAGIARPQDDEQQHADDQSKDSQEGKDALTQEQKTINKLQRRIDRLTAQKGGSQAEAQMLRDRLAQLEARQQPQDEGNDRQQPKATTEHDIEAKAAELAQEMLERKQVAEKLSKVMEKGKKLEGFGAAVDALHDEVPITDRSGRPTAFFAAVLDSDDPAALAHYLGNNPDEAAEYRGLSPAQIGRRLAKLEDRLKQGANGVSKAPTPLAAIKSVAAPSKSLSDLSGDDFVRRRRQQIAARSR